MRIGLLTRIAFLGAMLVSQAWSPGEAWAAPTGEVIRVDVDLALPLLGTPVAGTFTFVELTEARDRDTGRWTFVGTSNGRAAVASGTAWYGRTFPEGAGCRAEVAFDRIATWTVPGIPRPPTPLAVTLHAVDRTVTVALGPLRVPFTLDRPLCWSAGGEYRIVAPGE